MEAQDLREDAGDEARARHDGRRALRALRRHVWAGVKRNRVLVVVVIVTAALEAFFTG